MSNILLLHPGEMGASLGRELARVGHDVHWVSTARSEETRTRATAANLIASDSLEEVLTHVETVLSVCPPEYAYEVAISVAHAGYKGIFVDVNAISPETAETIGEIFNEEFVDGSIIGPPVTERSSPRLYFSGTQANSVTKLFDNSVVRAKMIDVSRSATASLKMCYAAYTKGSSALILAIRALAEARGVTDALFDEWEISQPELRVRSERGGPSTSRKGWRFAGEMEEIAKTFAQSGLPNGFHLGAAEVCRRMTPFKGMPPATTQQVIEALISQQDS